MRNEIIRRVVLSVCFLLLAAPVVVFADGMLIPERPIHIDPPIEPMPPIPMFTVKYHNVEVEINDQAATTEIDQVFKSESNMEIEATYLFPLPESAGITDFSMFVNGKKLDGKLLDRDEARRIYEEIVRRRKDPALLEYVGRDMFKASVYPIPPHGEQKIQLKYQELNKAFNDTYHYVYPLNTEKLSNKPLDSVMVHVKVRTSHPLKNIYSPSHKVSVRRISETEAEVTYEESNARPDRDFELFYSVSRDDIGLSIISHKDGSEDGYFLLLASPRFEIEESKVRPKDVLFVFDRTGSMSGEKIEQAREALKFCLNALNKKDRFNVISFNESPDPVFSSLVPANSENVRKALEVADGLTAVGGTNIDMALKDSFPMVNDKSRPSYVLFLTDGLPTVGVTDIQTILDNSKERAPEHMRLFVFGVGYDVNTHLLDKLSQRHNGMSEYVEPGEDLEVKVSNLFRMISNPVLTDIALDMGKSGAYDMAPVELPDIFKGTQLAITGRFRKAGETKIVLSGIAEGSKRDFTLKTKMGVDANNPFIPTLWASRRIGMLLDEIRLHGENKELVEEVVRLSKLYGIITEYTSYLVEEPGGFEISLEDATDVAEERLMTANEAQSGQWAVNQSTANKSLKKQESVSQDAFAQYRDKDGEVRQIETVKNFQDRAFYKDDNAWKDSRFDEEMKIIKVQNFSAAQFELIEMAPHLGKYFSMGDSVLVVLDDKLAVQTFNDSGVTNLDMIQKQLIQGALSK